MVADPLKCNKKIFGSERRWGDRYKGGLEEEERGGEYSGALGLKDTQSFQKESFTVLGFWARGQKSNLLGLGLFLDRLGGLLF